MTQQRWDIPDVSDDDQSPERATPTLVSLHFIRAALRRRWLVCVLSPLLGLLLAIAVLVAMPPSHKATASLVLAHDPQVDPSRAMATDVSLLQTRAVAARVEESLGLTMPPEDFLKSVTAVPVSSELLTLTLSAPTDVEAVRRLNALTSIYLTFRGEQLSLQSNVLIGSMQQRVAKLKAEVDTTSRQIDELSAAGSSSADKLGDQIAQRAYVQGRIDTLQQSIEDMTLQTTSVVASSRVIDPAAAETGGVKKRVVLILASGIIGGAAVGWGTVLFFAIISDRLRRRSDISEALEMPVPVSVGRITPVPVRWRRIPQLRTLNSRRADDRQRVAHAIELELPVPLQHGRIAIACIDNADEVRFAIAEAAADLATSGLSVAVVDLTQQGSLDSKLAEFIAGSSAPPAVLRPHGIPELATASDLRAVGPEQEDRPSPSLEQADVVLVLADLDSSVGADYLTTWTDRVIFAVTSGRSSAERLRTAADLARNVGLDLRFAALLRTERTDDSLGGTFHAETVAAETADLDQDFEESQPSVASSDIAELDAAGDELPDAEEHLVTAVTGDDQVIAEEPPVDIDATFENMQFEELQFDELQLEELQLEDGQAVGEQPAELQPVAEAQLVDEEELGISDEHAEDEVVASVEEVAGSDEYSEEQPIVEIEAIGEEEYADEQQAEDEVAATDEQQAEDEVAATDEQQAEDEVVPEDAEVEVVAGLEEVAGSDGYSEEQLTVEIEAMAEEEQAEHERAEDEEAASPAEAAATDEHAEEQPTVEIEAIAEDEQADNAQADNAQAEEEEATFSQLPEDERAVDAESIASELIAAELIAAELIGSEQIGYELPAEGQPAEEEPAIQEHVAAEEHLAGDDETRVAPEEPDDDGGGEAELTAKADEVVSPPSDSGIVEGRYLDTAKDPAVPVGAVAIAWENFDWSWSSSPDDTEAEQPEVALGLDLETAPQTSQESAPSSDDNELDPNHHRSLEEPDTIEEVDTNQVDGWLLYIDRYPEVSAGTALSFEDEKPDGSSDWDFDGLGSGHDSAVVGADDEVDEPSHESQLTASANGENHENHQSASEIHAEEQPQNGAHRPAGNGQGSNGRVRQRARSRNRRRRSKIK